MKTLLACLAFLFKKDIADWRRRAQMTPEQLLAEQAEWYW